MAPRRGRPPLPPSRPDPGHRNDGAGGDSISGAPFGYGLTDFDDEPRVPAPLPMRGPQQAAWSGHPQGSHPGMPGGPYGEHPTYAGGHYDNRYDPEPPPRPPPSGGHGQPHYPPPQRHPPSHGPPYASSSYPTPHYPTVGPVHHPPHPSHDSRDMYSPHAEWQGQRRVASHPSYPPHDWDHNYRSPGWQQGSYDMHEYDHDPDYALQSDFNPQHPSADRGSEYSHGAIDPYLYDDRRRHTIPLPSHVVDGTFSLPLFAAEPSQDAARARRPLAPLGAGQNRSYVGDDGSYTERELDLARMEAFREPSPPHSPYASLGGAASFMEGTASAYAQSATSSRAPAGPPRHTSGSATDVNRPQDARPGAAAGDATGEPERPDQLAEPFFPGAKGVRKGPVDLKTAFEGLGNTGKRGSKFAAAIKLATATADLRDEFEKELQEICSFNIDLSSKSHMKQRLSMATNWQLYLRYMVPDVAEENHWERGVIRAHAENFFAAKVKMAKGKHGHEHVSSLTVKGWFDLFAWCVQMFAFTGKDQVKCGMRLLAGQGGDGLYFVLKHRIECLIRLFKLRRHHSETVFWGREEARLIQETILTSTQTMHRLNGVQVMAQVALAFLTGIRVSTLAPYDEDYKTRDLCLKNCNITIYRLEGGKPRFRVVVVYENFKGNNGIKGVRRVFVLDPVTKSQNAIFDPVIIVALLFIREDLDVKNLDDLLHGHQSEIKVKNPTLPVFRKAGPGGHGFLDEPCMSGQLTKNLQVFLLICGLGGTMHSLRRGLGNEIGLLLGRDAARQMLVHVENQITAELHYSETTANFHSTALMSGEAPEAQAPAYIEARARRLFTAPVIRAGIRNKYGDGSLGPAAQAVEHEDAVNDGPSVPAKRKAPSDDVPETVLGAWRALCDAVPDLRADFIRNIQNRHFRDEIKRALDKDPADGYTPEMVAELKLAVESALDEYIADNRSAPRPKGKRPKLAALDDAAPAAPTPGVLPLAKQRKAGIKLNDEQVKKVQNDPRVSNTQPELTAAWDALCRAAPELRANFIDKGGPHFRLEIKRAATLPPAAGYTPEQVASLQKEAENQLTKYQAAKKSSNKKVKKAITHDQLHLNAQHPSVEITVEQRQDIISAASAPSPALFAARKQYGDQSRSTTAVGSPSSFGDAGDAHESVADAATPAQSWTEVGEELLDGVDSAAARRALGPALNSAIRQAEAARPNEQEHGVADEDEEDPFNDENEEELLDCTADEMRGCLLRYAIEPALRQKADKVIAHDLKCPICVATEDAKTADDRARTWLNPSQLVYHLESSKHQTLLNHYIGTANLKQWVCPFCLHTLATKQRCADHVEKLHEREWNLIEQRKAIFDSVVFCRRESDEPGNALWDVVLNKVEKVEDGCRTGAGYVQYYRNAA